MRNARQQLLAATMKLRLLRAPLWRQKARKDTKAAKPPLRLNQRRRKDDIPLQQQPFMNFTHIPIYHDRILVFQVYLLFSACYIDVASSNSHLYEYN